MVLKLYLFCSQVHSPRGWHVKWTSNKDLFKRLLIVRQRNATSHKVAPRVHKRKHPTEMSPPKKRVRRESLPPAVNPQPSAPSTPAFFSGNRTAAVDRTKILPLMIPHFIKYIQRKRPTTSRAILDMWTEISMDKEFRGLNVTVDDLMPIYYTKQQIFAPILDGL
ncbi:hypothetical protein DL93DRAFT_2086400 [Clavulina sp. PMI_390]|nr:hypothetical protein DL93DRAFT_2086400 [Clavulina sp. PMI_390]